MNILKVRNILDPAGRLYGCNLITDKNNIRIHAIAAGDEDYYGEYDSEIKSFISERKPYKSVTDPETGYRYDYYAKEVIQ